MKRLLPLLFLIVMACTPATGDIMGLEDVLPDHWVAELEDTTGSIGSPAGLDEALARVDLKFTQSVFIAKDKEVNPSLVLWFYPRGDRGEILQVIEDSAALMGEIPLFFVESKHYVIVTSSLGFNHGYQGIEAAPLVPLEAALKQYFSQGK